MKISQGQKASIQILVAKELGFESISFENEAKKFLMYNKITPALTISFLNEAERATDLILRNNLLEKALQLSEKHLKNK